MTNEQLKVQLINMLDRPEEKDNHLTQTLDQIDALLSKTAFELTFHGQNFSKIAYEFRSLHTGKSYVFTKTTISDYKREYEIVILNHLHKAEETIRLVETPYATKLVCEVHNQDNPALLQSTDEYLTYRAGSLFQKLNNVLRTLVAFTLVKGIGI